MVQGYDEQTGRPEGEGRSSGDSLGGWGIVEVLVKNRRVIIWYPVIVAIAVAVFSLVIPAQYIGKVSILPPDSDFQSSALSALPLAEFGLGGGMSLPFMSTPSDILAQVLLSRRVLQSVVDSLDLKTVWGMPTRAAAVDALSSNLNVVVELTGMVNVTVKDGDAKRAAQLSNVLVRRADRINREITNAKARNVRQFIGERLAETRTALARAGANLEAFQRVNKTVSLDDELRALIQNMADLKAGLTADEIELAILKKSMSSANPRVSALENRIAETRRQLRALESGGDTSGAIFSTGLAGAPKLIFDLAEKVRQVKIEETLLELLTSQYESAKIQEAKDTPTISVLDWAEPNPKRYRPRRARLVIAAYVSSVVVVVALVFVAEYFAVMRRRDPHKYERLQEAVALMRRDGLGLKKQKD